MYKYLFIFLLVAPAIKSADLSELAKIAGELRQRSNSTGSMEAARELADAARALNTAVVVAKNRIASPTHEDHLRIAIDPDRLGRFVDNLALAVSATKDLGSVMCSPRSLEQKEQRSRPTTPVGSRSGTPIFFDGPKSAPASLTNMPKVRKKKSDSELTVTAGDTEVIQQLHERQARWDGIINRELEKIAQRCAEIDAEDAAASLTEVSSESDSE